MYLEINAEDPPDTEEVLVFTHILQNTHISMTKITKLPKAP